MNDEKDFNKIASFSSASVFPAKLLKVKVLKGNKIIPIHVQLNPTNVCNFNCPFCSCGNRDKTVMLPFEDIVEIMTRAKECGCKSVTITGGGEPLMHPQINEIITYLAEKLGLKVGIVTNGSMITMLKPQTLFWISWIRISASDYLEEQLATGNMPLKAWFDMIEQFSIIGNVDWAFSYVLSSKPKFELLAKIIDFANKHSFTHVRIVSDLLDLENVPDMDKVRLELKKLRMNDKLVIYQERKDHTIGTKRCLISLLKPVVGPDGKLYPCCGTQYALNNPSGDYEKTMCMGDAKKLDLLFESQKCFDGSICKRCYYSDYNWALNVITTKLIHEEFV